ncbi:MAG: carboxypeptidase-like regulatory domain-containing protein, partial [Chitinophagaceae bacterium]|nr:carboxypeptidase-like regulatory domain-containing protein [Chitinophagaceae bacterium]
KIYRRLDTSGYLEYDLSRSDNLLREVVIKPGEDPALTLVKNIIKNKPNNNPDKYKNYKYELYNKLELDLVRMSRAQFAKIPMMKPFAFIFDNVDSLTEQKPFLPVFLTETLSDYYFQRSPKKTKEFVKASQIKGIENESVTQFLGGMYQQINLYDNFIDIFDKQFVSPINNSAPNYYKYKIVDTQYAYGQRIILVQFAPRRAAENCFVGDFWVADSVYALQRISLDIAADANINLVNRVSLYQEFAPVGDSLWFNVKDKFIADFTVPYGGKKMPGFIGRKTTSYKNILLNDTTVANVVNDKKLKQDVIISEGARDKGNEFWADNRHDTLNKNEKAIYAMIDTLNAMPIFNRTKNILSFLAKGTQNVGKFEFGPYWAIYNRNPIEGNRFRFSMGTNTKMFKDLYLNGYVAYGTNDERFKYKVAGLWLLERHPRHRIYASYTSDLDRSISYYSEAATDNFLSSLVRKQYLPFKLAFVKDARLEHYKEYFNGFSHELTFLRKEFTPYAPLPATTIFRNTDGSPSANVINSEVGIKLRFAYKERFLEGDYYRLSIGSKYPVVSVRLALGLKNVLQSGYEYQKLSVNISDYVKLPHFGAISYNVFAGKHFGTLPYPLLEVHPGNDFYYYNQFAFSMMNRFEFISDAYAGFMFEHNIGGGFFNYIPLLKKVKLRQFYTVKSAIGKLSDANKMLNLNQGFEFKTLQGNPYLEIGTGIDNIFQLFRVDFVWRVAPAPLANEPLGKRFGVFGSFRVGF